MARKLYEEASISDIADAIRAKGGSGTFTVGDMAQAIEDLPSGGSGEWTTDGIAIRTEPSGPLHLGAYNIGAFAFAYKSAITSLSGEANDVDDSAFLWCNGIRSVSFPNLAGQIRQNSFKDCRNLETIDVGKAYQINSSAFQNDYVLTTLILRGTSVCRLQNVTAFLQTPFRGYGGRTGEIYVPENLISSYQSATNWASIYAEGYVTFKKIEGSIYEI